MCGYGLLNFLQQIPSAQLFEYENKKGGSF
jgi:hypothetical protein